MVGRRFRKRQVVSVDSYLDTFSANSKKPGGRTMDSRAPPGAARVLPFLNHRGRGPRSSYQCKAIVIRPRKEAEDRAGAQEGGQGDIGLWAFLEDTRRGGWSRPSWWPGRIGVLLKLVVLDGFELCWRRLLQVPWTARRSNQSILKEIDPECSLEGLMLKQILWPPDAKSQLIGKDPDAGKD